MKVIRKARRLLSVPMPLLTGYYGAVLAKLSPDLHQQFIRNRLRGPYQGPILEELLAILDRLASDEDQQAATLAAANAIRGGLERGEFDRWVNKDSSRENKTTLIECADFLPGRSWKLQLFFIAEGHSHAPHSHSDVTSCLVVAKGRIHAREYDRFHELEDGTNHAVLALSSDRTLARGEALLTTRSSNDVHWFGAVEGPAVAFNFQAVGFARGRKPLEARRVYVDPTTVKESGRQKVPLLTRKEAKRRFGHRPVNDFPLLP